MKILSDTAHQSLPPLAATIGFFDGVHRGHCSLIEQVREVAAQDGLCMAPVTFPIHPHRVLQPDFRPQLLSSPQEKLELLGKTGADYCILLPFTRELSQLSAREFMEMLRCRFNIRTLVIGYDHRFGHNRSETFEDYRRYGLDLGICIVRAREYAAEGMHISSSAIRRLLQEGNVGRAATYLGYNYFLDGTVVDGYKVGRKIGFPTANLKVGCADKLVPAEGVYAVYVYVGGKKWGGMLNIGHRPTIGNGTDVSIEVNILGFSDNIYHRDMRIEFVKFLRPELKFDTIDALVAQMHRDKKKAASLLL